MVLTMRVDLNDEKTRLYNLRNGLGDILAALKDSLCLDVATHAWKIAGGESSPRSENCAVYNDTHEIGFSNLVCRSGRMRRRKL